MSLGEIAFYAAIVAILIVLFSKVVTFAFKNEKEYNSAMRDRLKDPYLYDPESGTLFTIDQVGKGSPDSEFNEYKIQNIKQQIPYFTEKEIIVEEIPNLLKSLHFQEIRLTQKQIKTLNRIESLSKYDDWRYNTSFDIGNGNIVLFPSFQHRGKTDFSNSKILFWLKVPLIGGHYFLREKETIEKVFDLLRNDDEFNFGNFEVFSIKSTKNRIHLLRNLDPFQDFENIEIEIKNDNLFIKTTDDISVGSFEKLFKVVEK